MFTLDDIKVLSINTPPTLNTIWEIFELSPLNEPVNITRYCEAMAVVSESKGIGTNVLGDTPLPCVIDVIPSVPSRT